MLHFFIGAFYAVALFFASEAFCVGDNTHLSKAKEIRQLVRNIILYSAKDQKEVPQYLKKLSLDSQPLVTDLLHDKDPEELDKIIQIADLPFDAQYFFGDFLALLQGKNIQAELSVFEDQQQRYQALKKNILNFSQSWTMLDTNTKVSLINSTPDAIYLKFASHLIAKIEKIDFAHEAGIKALRDPQQGINISYLPKAFIDLYNLLIDQYFSKFGTKDKIEIITEILNLPIPADHIEKLSVFVQHSGPVLQKFFQLMGNNVQSAQIKKVLNNLKSNIKPVSFDQIEKSIENTYSVSLSEMFTSFEKKPLAAATIAQVHVAVLKGSDKKIIVKVRRPGIEEKAKKELEIIKSLTNDSGILAVISNLEESIYEELDFRNEARFLRKGRVYNNKKRGIQAVALQRAYPVRENVLMMEKAPGSKIDREMNADELVYKAKGLEQLYHEWLSTALFDNGFFHADLHAGNLFYLRTFDKIGYLLTLIDFGSVGILTFAERKSLIKFSFGVYTEQVELIIAAFKDFQTLSDDSKREFTEKIQDILKLNLSNGEKTTLILNEAIAHEFDLSKNFLQFIRGKSFLEDHIYRNNLKLIELKLDKFVTPATKIYTDVLLGKMPLICKSYVLSKNKTQDPLIDKMVFKFAWKYISMRYIFPKTEQEDNDKDHH